MKILKLLEGLYQELKKFNENVEYLPLIEIEKKRNRENPMRVMEKKEKIALHRWIEKQMEAKKINPDDLLVEGHTRRSIEKFFQCEISCGTEYIRRTLSEALGFASFNDLLTAYRQKTKGGAE